MTGRGRFVEVQGSGEEATFSQEELDALVRLARVGIEQLRERQREALGADWPFGNDLAARVFGSSARSP